MEIDKFESWLKETFDFESSTIQNRKNNLKNIMQYYPDLDEMIQNGKVKQLLEDLNYTKDDEKNKLQPKHKIIIKGNIREGSGTYKRALNLYIQYWENVKNISVSKTQFETLFHRLKETITKFQVKKKSKYSTQEVKNLIQEPLYDELKEKFKEIEWVLEYGKDKNRIDIFGKIKNSESYIIIEIDTHRHDQISPKYVSRIANFIYNNIIYFTICYPNDHKNKESEKKLANKYCNYLQYLTRILSENSNKEIYYYYHKINYK